jgi:hypothetical protein
MWLSLHTSSALPKHTKLKMENNWIRKAMWKFFTHFHDLKHESLPTGEKIYRCKHNEPVCIHSIYHQTNVIIQSVTNLREATYIEYLLSFALPKNTC